MTRLVFVGEAWGEQEQALKHPFVGPAGFELLRLFEDSGILTLTDADKSLIQQRWNAQDVLAAHYVKQIWEAHSGEFVLTNVFNLRPGERSNDLGLLCCPKTGDRAEGLAPLKTGAYLRREFLPEINRLHSELKTHAPNLIVALGGTATWALLGNTGISKIRGTVSFSTAAGAKVLPVYHPSAILHQYDLRAVTVLDLQKARLESTFKEIRRPERRVYVEPTLQDLEWFFNYHIAKAKYIAPDIETVDGQISCIGFGTSKEVAIVVPFIDNRRAIGSYWPSLEEEAAAWRWVKKVLQTPQPKIFQNGVYDVNYLWRVYGIPVKNFSEDTMLLHHSLQPESPKGLGYLGSVYTQESAWKLLGRTATIKRDN